MHVGLRLRGQKAQRAETVFDGRRRRGHARQAILDVDDVPAHLHPGQDLRHRTFLVARGPEAAVEIHHRRLRRRRAAPVVDIQLRLIVAGGQIGEVRRRLIGGIRVCRPCRGRGELRREIRRRDDRNQNQDSKEESLSWAGGY